MENKIEPLKPFTGNIFIDLMNQTEYLSRFCKQFSQKIKSMSNKPTVYILQRDLPDAKAGTRYTHNQFTGFFEVLGVPIDQVHPRPYYDKIVYEMPEWWLPEEDHEVAKAKELLCAKGYAVFSKDQDSLSEKIKELYGVAGLKYTEEDIENAFMAARETYNVEGLYVAKKYNSSRDYINSLNKQTNGTR